MHLNNSFISTTMCDDLARATEAQDGKKKAMKALDGKKSIPGSSIPLVPRPCGVIAVASPEHEMDRGHL